MESTLFTFLPASLLQVLWLVLVIALPPDVRLSRADFYLRMFNVIFSLNFGLLAVWWATARIHTQEAAQSDARLLMAGAGCTPEMSQDISLLDWALGPLTPEPDKWPALDSCAMEKLTPQRSVEEECLAEEEDCIDEAWREDEGRLRRRQQNASLGSH